MNASLWIHFIQYQPHGRSGPETQTKRQATQHGFLSSLLGDGDKGIEKVYDEEKNILNMAN